MPDEAAEFREIVLGAVERQVNIMSVDQGLAFAPGMAVPGNPFGGVMDEEQEVRFGTGFDGTDTLVPFTLDVSTMDPPGTDVLI